MLRSHIRELVDDPELASDIFQEVILRLLSDATGPEELGAFVDYGRQLAEEVARAPSRQSRELPLEDDPLDPWLDPERTMDTREALERAVHHLGDDARELLVRRYVLGENARELAFGSRQSPAALRVRLMRLRCSAKNAR
jgi:DNA-directed RNA polymerase specialized sigma24 family protein